MHIVKGRIRRFLLVSLLLMVGAGMVWQWWPQPRAALYSFYRERGKAAALADLAGYQNRSSDHFQVFFTQVDQNVVGMVLETAEAVYHPVISQVGHRPAAKIPLIIHASRAEMRAAFGWGQTESAIGVYWAGTIRLLSPNVWAPKLRAKDQAKVFRKLNPLAHELTHLVLDYHTNGNYPRWFTEGLAQRVEHQVSGYLWIEPESTLRQRLYTRSELERSFAQLENQPLAYRQSFLLVEYMVQEYGEESLSRLIGLLGQGVPFRTAVQSALGVSVAVLFEEWFVWVNANLEELETRYHLRTKQKERAI